MTAGSQPSDKVVKAALDYAFRDIADLYPGSIERTHPARPLFELAANNLKVREFVATLAATPKETQQIARRLIALYTGPKTRMLAARMTHETDDHAYLATGVNSLEFLVAVIMDDKSEAFPIRVILTNKNLSDDERISQILALRSDAADIISRVYAGGPEATDKNRYYVGSLKGHIDHFGVVDRTTNAVLYSSSWTTKCHGMAKALNAFPDLAESLVTLVSDYHAIALPTRNDHERFAQDRMTLLADIEEILLADYA